MGLFDAIKAASIGSDVEKVQNDPVGSIMHPLDTAKVGKEVTDNLDNSYLQKGIADSMHTAINGATQKMEGMTANLPGGDIMKPVIEGAGSIANSMADKMADIMKNHGEEIANLSKSIKLDQGFSAANGALPTEAVNASKQMLNTESLNKVAETIKSAAGGLNIAG